MKTGRLDPEQVKRAEAALDSVPFAKLLGIELEQIDTGTATLAFEIRPELKQNTGVVHGGAIASLIDSATAFAIISLLPPDERATTVDLTISYLRALNRGRARATARVLRVGKLDRGLG
ncbi:MAG: PaaI family thioesterase [Pyrinomonadaceae bacterium]